MVPAFPLQNTCCALSYGKLLLPAFSHLPQSFFFSRQIYRIPRQIHGILPRNHENSLAFDETLACNTVKALHAV